MADKPYIEFRLNPDKMKEEIKGIIPGYRALEYFRNNPDSSFTNTLDLLAEDVVPFYAAHKYGAGPGDYIKEAVLMGMPIPKAKFKPYFRSGAVDDLQYKFVKAASNSPNFNPKGVVYIDEEGKYFVRNPNTNNLVDMTNYDVVDPNDPYRNYYDATTQDLNNTYNEYQFMLDNLSPAKLKKARRFSGAGEDVQVGKNTYKPLSFYHRYNEVLDEIAELNKKVKRGNITPNQTLKLKQLESELKMLESADDFTQGGPYLKDDGTNAFNNAMSDNSKHFIPEEDGYMKRKDPWWIGTMRDWKKSDRYDP